MKMKKWFWGLFFILAGVAIIINSLGIFTSINIISLLLTLCLIAIMIKSIMYLSFSGFLIPLALIGVIYAKELNIMNITPWPLLITALLLSIGLEIIFGSLQKKVYFSKYHKDISEHFSEIIDEDDNDEVNYQVRYGSGVKYVNSDNLKIAHLNCVCGALKVYFDNSKVSDEGAQIILNASLSGVELYIPKEWNVIIDAQASLSGVEEKNRRLKSDGPKVVIKGRLNLSGIEIIYV